MKKGFTLIELLAVIVILAIIALIATPTIIGLIDDARKEAFKSSAYGIVKAGEILYAEDMMNGTVEEVTFTYTDGEESSASAKQLEYKGKKPNSGNVIINNNGEVAILIYNGTLCAEKGYNESEIRITNKPKDKCEIPISFACGDTLFDSRDGLAYATVQIGEQCWMAENLRYTDNGCLSKTWDDNDPDDACASKNPSWGEEILYQFGAAMNGSTTAGAQGLCPEGWHIPIDTEWTTLINSVGATPGTKLKTTTPIWDGSDTVGFNAKPAGYRRFDGLFFMVGSFSYFRTSSFSDSFAWVCSLLSGSSDVDCYNNSQANGGSVRCLLGQ